MSDYDTYLKAFDKMSDEEIATTLLSETRQSALVITDYALQMASLIEQVDSAKLPEHLEEDCQSLLNIATKIDQYLNLFLNIPEDHRLRLFTFEMKSPVSALIGYAHLMPHTIENQDLSDLKRKFDYWCQEILTITTRIKNMIDAAQTSRMPPNIRQEYENRS